MKNTTIYTPFQSLSAWLVLFLAINGFAAIYTFLLSSEQNFFQPNSEFPWQSALQIHLIRWNTWILFVPLILRLAKNYRLDAGHVSLRAVAVHCFAGVAIPVFHFVFMRNIAYLFGHDETIRLFHEHTLWWMIVRFFVTPYGFLLSLSLYWIWVAGAHALGFYRRYREQELRASQFETQLANARLDALKAQLHPHFLFNTLNSISTLLYKDIELADTMLARLGDFLRMTLESGDGQFVSLREEFDFVRCYLEIETLRFHDRIRYELSLPPNLDTAAVPNMLLQPLVENAVQHGFSADYLQDGVITVRAWQDDNHSLTIEVCDTGSGFDGADFREGIGLGNTRARIATLYGADGYFSIKSYVHNGMNGGTRVRITIPFQLISPTRARHFQTQQPFALSPSFTDKNL